VTIRTARLRSRLVVVLTLVALLTIPLTGCRDNGPGDLPPPPSPAGTAAPESTVDPVRQAVLDTYRGSVQAMMAAQQAGDPDYPDLTRYFIERGSAFNSVRSGIQRHGARGTYYRGELMVVTAEVTEVDQDAEPPEATIESCLDDTNYQLVHRGDGSVVPEAEPGGRYRVTSTALLGNDDRWYIVASTAHWEESC
jgi:predicted small lipoprotein YifL